MSKKLLMIRSVDNMDFILGNNIIYRGNTRTHSGAGNDGVLLTDTKVLDFVSLSNGDIRLAIYIRTDTDVAVGDGIQVKVLKNGVDCYNEILRNSIGLRKQIDLINIKSDDKIEVFIKATPTAFGGNKFNGIDICCGNETPINKLNVVEVR